MNDSTVEMHYESLVWIGMGMFALFLNLHSKLQDNINIWRLWKKTLSIREQFGGDSYR